MPGRTVTVELSEEQARWIDEQVEAGEYPDQPTLLVQALETGLKWVRETSGTHEADWVVREVLPALERLGSDPARGYSIDQARSELEHRRAMRAADL